MNFKVDEDFALLYGIMLGDGCLSLVNKKIKTITITGSSKNDLPFFESIISPILLKFRQKETKIKLRRNYNAIEFNFTDFRLFDFIHSFGFPIGKKGNRLFIPNIFYEKGLVEYVISGFFATDGSIVLTKNPNKFYPRLEAHVIAHNLVKEIYNYMIRVGFKGHFYKCKRKIRDLRWKNVKDQYRFQFNGKENLLLFEEKIGFINPTYQKKFKTFLEYEAQYAIEKMAAPRIELGTPSS